jgi:hypothetical protein
MQQQQQQGQDMRVMSKDTWWPTAHWRPLLQHRHTTTTTTHHHAPPRTTTHHTHHHGHHAPPPRTPRTTITTHHTPPPRTTITTHTTTDTTHPGWVCRVGVVFILIILAGQRAQALCRLAHSIRRVLAGCLGAPQQPAGGGSSGSGGRQLAEVPGLPVV